MAYCTYCGKDHPVALCPHTWGGSAAWGAMYCGYCGSTKHMIEYCPSTYGGEAARRNNPNGNFLD